MSKTHSVLKDKAKANWYKHTRADISDSDASLYISHSDLILLAAKNNQSIQQQQNNDQQHPPDQRSTTSLCSPVKDILTSFSPYQPLSYQYLVQSTNINDINNNNYGNFSPS